MIRGIGVAVLLLAAVAQQAGYHITHTYSLGGDGFWDYVVPDPPNHRLFIARQTRVMVVDEDTGKLLGEVNGINGAHGVAVVGDTGHGFGPAEREWLARANLAGSIVLTIVLWIVGGYLMGGLR